MTKKITKKENFTAIAAYLAENGKNDWADVINHEIELLDKKAATAKAKAAEKKATADELAEVVASVLTSEPQTIGDIATQVEFPEATTAKIQYRLRVLAEQGRAVKSEVTVAGGEGTKSRKLVAYAISTEDAE